MDWNNIYNHYETDMQINIYNNINKHLSILCFSPNKIYTLSIPVPNNVAKYFIGRALMIRLRNIVERVE